MTLQIDVERIFDGCKYAHVTDHEKYVAVDFMVVPIVDIYKNPRVAEFAGRFKWPDSHGPRIVELAEYLDKNSYCTNLHRDPTKAELNLAVFARTLSNYASRGMTRSEIAAATGYSYSYITRMARQLGIDVIHKKKKYPSAKPNIQPAARSARS